MTTPVRLSINARLWLLLMVLAVLLPLGAQLPIWLPVLACVLIIWRLLQLKRPLPEPKPWLRIGITLLVGFGVLVSAAGGDGLRGLAVMLVAGAVLKLLELRTQRDGWTLVLVSCFVAAVGFLFNQSFFFALYGLLVLWLIVTALVALHQSPLTAFSWAAVSLSGRMLVCSLPVMLVLFLVFPRLAPLWQVQFKNNVAKTGLSDTLTPGSVSQLTRASEMAFRVSFTGELPPAAQRYWRAMTFRVFDGVGWQREEASPVRSLSSETEEAIRYEVIAEPSGQPWLFALANPITVSGGAVLLNNQTVQSSSIVAERTRYLVVSQRSSVPVPLTAEQRAAYLQLPASGNPQTRAQIAQWQQAGLTPDAMIDKIYALFYRAFTYTLSPPLQHGRNAIDQFLFIDQAGFCEHFASATAYMLRLAGVPARVVGGYLGGEWNPFENYLLVRQYEAHAWVEYWDDRQGWVRLDPTAAVSPERIEQPFSELFAEAPAFLGETPLALLNLERNIAWLSQVRLRYEAFNYRWQRWVMGYHHHQTDLLRQWLGAWSVLKGVAIVVGIGVLLGLILAGLVRHRKPALHPLEQDVARLSALAEKQGSAPRAMHETVTGFTVRLSQEYPRSAVLLHTWAQHFTLLRYGNPQDLHLQRAYRASFRRLLHQFKRSSIESHR